MPCPSCATAPTTELPRTTIRGVPHVSLQRLPENVQ